MIFLVLRKITSILTAEVIKGQHLCRIFETIVYLLLQIYLFTYLQLLNEQNRIRLLKKFHEHYNSDDSS